MKYVLYALSALSILLAVGGLSAYSQTKHILISKKTQPREWREVGIVRSDRRQWQGA